MTPTDDGTAEQTVNRGASNKVDIARFQLRVYDTLQFFI